MKSKKGSKFERDICRLLSLWWSSGQDDDLFWRTAGSGGRATQRAKKGKQTAGGAGDITNTDERGAPFIKMFTPELKRGYSIGTPARRADIHHCLDKKDSGLTVIDSWIVQAQRSADSEKRNWFIIHQRDRQDVLVYFPEKLLKLEVDSKLVFSHLMLMGCDMVYIKRPSNKLEPTLCAMRLTDFLKCIRIKRVKAANV